MNLVYKYGHRYGLIPRDESANPMNWVRQKTTSNYTAVIMNSQQAFEILLNIQNHGAPWFLQIRRQLCEYLAHRLDQLRICAMMGLQSPPAEYLAVYSN
jgi:hypothetical protein